MTTILRSDIDGVAVLTLNRPQALNALNTALLAELDAHLDRIEDDDSRAFVLTGAGRAFCVGSDLKEGGGDPEGRIRHMHGLMLRMHDFPKLGVAAISGFAFGGGLELAMGCTFRIADPAATFGQPEVKLGLIPAYGATQTLPRLIGPGRALDMMLSGDPIGAETALAWGLIDRISEDVVSAAVDFALKRAGNTPVAEAAIRQAIRASALPLEQGLDAERRLALQVAEGDEAKAGLAAFRAR
jgi:enoyl-CoA hydratase